MFSHFFACCFVSECENLTTVLCHLKGTFENISAVFHFSSHLDSDIHHPRGRWWREEPWRVTWKLKYCMWNCFALLWFDVCMKLYCNYAVLPSRVPAQNTNWYSWSLVWMQFNRLKHTTNFKACHLYWPKWHNSDTQSTDPPAPDYLKF